MHVLPATTFLPVSDDMATQWIFYERFGTRLSSSGVISAINPITEHQRRERRRRLIVALRTSLGAVQRRKIRAALALRLRVRRSLSRVAVI